MGLYVGKGSFPAKIVLFRSPDFWTQIILLLNPNHVTFEGCACQTITIDSSSRVAFWDFVIDSLIYNAMVKGLKWEQNVQGLKSRILMKIVFYLKCWNNFGDKSRVQNLWVISEIGDYFHLLSNGVQTFYTRNVGMMSHKRRKSRIENGNRHNPNIAPPRRFIYDF